MFKIGETFEQSEETLVRAVEQHNHHMARFTWPQVFWWSIACYYTDLPVSLAMDTARPHRYKLFLDGELFGFVRLSEGQTGVYCEITPFYAPVDGKRISELETGLKQFVEQTSNKAPSQDEDEALKKRLIKLYPREWATALEIIQLDRSQPELQRWQQANKLSLGIDAFEVWVTKLTREGLMRKRRRA